MEEANPIDIEMEGKMNAFMNQTESIKEELLAAVQQKVRFNINLDQMRTYDESLTRYVIKNPVKGIALFEKKLNDMSAELLDG
jgi:DNA replication licensing factor MCM3